MKQAALLCSLLLAAALFGVGCQTLNRSRFHSEARVIKLAEAGAYEATFRITEGSGEKAVTIATPKVVFRAGEPARVEVGNQQRMIFVDVYVPKQGDDPLCLCKTTIRQDGRFVFRHTQIVTPKAK